MKNMSKIENKVIRPNENKDDERTPAKKSDEKDKQVNQNKAQTGEKKE